MVGKITPQRYWFGMGFAVARLMNLRLISGLLAAILVSTSCRVDQAIEAEDSWFYSRRPTRSVFTSVGNDTLHWTQTGTGTDTVLLVHGFGPYPTVQWQPVVWKYSDTKTLIVVDLLGFGKSCSPDTAVTVAQQVAALRSALDQRGISRVHLVGHSYGGMVSTLFASQFPDRVRSLVLIDPLHRHFELRHLDSLQRLWGRPIEEVLLPRDVESYDAMMAVSVKDPFFLPSFMKQQVLETIYQVNVAQREAMLRAVRRDELMLKANATGSNVPTLLIWGEGDALFPPRGAVQLARDFPKSRTVLIPNAGHIPHMERPFVVLDSLEVFFSAQSPK
jgi:pimeloyl-ACP methyl ester carboxylesterase